MRPMSSRLSLPPRAHSAALPRRRGRHDLPPPSFSTISKLAKLSATADINFRYLTAVGDKLAK